MLWGTTTFALAMALAAPGAASAASCTPLLTNPIVRFATTFGNIDVQLNTTDAPCTVNNFLYYVQHGLYDGTFFHRSVNTTVVSGDPDVIQGGGYKLSSGPPTAIPTNPAGPVPNEFKDSNVAGTLAMALTSGTNSVNSATDQFFFNVADNSSILNPQDFTVFGQVLDPASTFVMDVIGAAKICSLSMQWSDTASVFATVPTVNYSAACATDSPAATAANLITINSVKVLTDTAAPAITIASPALHQTYNLGQQITPSYTCSDGTGVGVDTCTGPTAVDTSLYGTLQYTVSTTDYAGNEGSKTVTYVVELPPQLQSVGTVSSKGVLSLKVHCPSSVACTGAVGLVAGKPTALIGGGRFEIRSGGTASVRVPLTTAGWRMFRAAKWRLKASLLLAPSGTGSKSFTNKVTLTRAKAPGKPKKHKKHKKPPKKSKHG
jgi:peptidyl-prolyl cis-trans isomerase A (cyclophilin A)